MVATKMIEASSNTPCEAAKKSRTTKGVPMARPLSTKIISPSDSLVSTSIGSLAHRSAERHPSHARRAGSSIVRRKHERLQSSIRAILYSDTKFQSVVIRNISRGGAGLENCGHLIENDVVTIALLNGRRIDAKVRWWFAGVCGVQFFEVLPSDDPLLAVGKDVGDLQK